MNLTKKLKFLRKKIIGMSLHIFYNLFNILSVQFRTLVFNESDLKQYSRKNNINLRFKNLVSNLDIKSKVIIETTLFRIFNPKKFIKLNDFSKFESNQLIKESNFEIKGQTNNSLFKINNLYSKIYPGFENYEISVFKFHHGLALIQKEINNYFKGKAAIDGGGYIFDTAVILSCNYKFKEIISFEIEKNNFEQGITLLKNNYKHLRNIKTINLGISSKPGYVNITGSESITKVSSLPSILIDSMKKNVTTIDIFTLEHRLKVGFIKLDIEGSEYDAILGAKKTIKRDLPIMSISIYHTVKDFFEIKPLIESFVPDKYDYYVRKLAPSYYQYETYLICIPKSLNLKLNNYEDIDIYG